MKKIIRAVIFLSIMAGAIYSLNHVMLNRESDGSIQLYDFYELEKDRVDVLCIGSSHVYYGYNTCQLYDDYGIASYLLSSSGQPVWVSYYLLEEALKSQQPKLVLFDTGTLFRREEDFQPSSWEVLLGMKPSRTKWKALKEVSSYDPTLDTASAFFTFPYYHTRFLSLTRQDYEGTEEIRYMGYKPRFGTITESELENAQKAESGRRGGITERAEKYLLKIMRLCRDRNIPMAIANTPYANLSDAKRKANAYIKTLADQYDIPVLEGNDLTREMQIRFSDDLLDPSHLNYDGSVKFTAYLGEWLKDRYSLPDRRGEKQYQKWEETSARMRHVELNGQRLMEAQTADAYLRILEEWADDLVTVCWNQNGKAQVYDGGRCIFEGPLGQEYSEYFAVGDSDLTVSCVDGQIQVLLNNEPFCFSQDGLNILVYDKIAEQLLDGIGLEGEDSMQIVRKQEKEQEEQDIEE